MSTVRAGLSVLVFLGACAAAAQTGPNPYLGQAKDLYQELEFEQCLARLDQAARWPHSTPKELTEIEIYAGLCHFNLENVDQAETRFRAALKLNPAVTLPPYTSPRINALLYKLKGELAATAPPPSDSPTQPELAPPPPSNPPPALNDLTAKGPRGRSLTVPLALGGVAVVAAGAATFLGLQARSLEQQAHAAHFESDAIALGQTAQQRATFANVGFAVAGAAITGAVLSYLLSGDGEHAGAER
ncbi:MAG: hypothetical protein IRZ16_18385 [Myxococcaceae bacterium]|nr:hypothetical protein [Myxococcaceae bacterium]